MGEFPNSNVRLPGLNATEEEKREVTSMLKSLGLPITPKIAA
jgi:hypothetical protein